MSVIGEIIAVIEKRGPSTLDDIAPLFPDLPRVTVQKALANAKARGFLEIRSRRTWLGRRGQAPCIYAVPGSRRIASVWDLAA